MTKQWKGGLPPVGELCECRATRNKNASFYRVTVDYIGKTAFVATKEIGGEIHNYLSAFEFRPIPTEPEERKELCKLLDSRRSALTTAGEWDDIVIDLILERESKLKDEIAELKADKQAIVNLSAGWEGYGEVEYAMANINAIAAKHIDKTNK